MSQKKKRSAQTQEAFPFEINGIRRSLRLLIKAYKKGPLIVPQDERATKIITNRSDGVDVHDYFEMCHMKKKKTFPKEGFIIWK